MSHVSLLPEHTVLVVSKEFQHSRHAVHTLLFNTTSDKNDKTRNDKVGGTLRFASKKPSMYSFKKISMHFHCS